MKIAYLLSHDIRIDNGVTNKVKQQVQIWQALGHKVEVFALIVSRLPIEGCCFHNYHLFTVFPSIYHRLTEPDNLVASLTEYGPDVIYLRFESYKPYMTSFLDKIPTVIEINSNDVSEYRLLADKHIKGKLFFYYNLLTRRLLFEKVAGIVGVTEELLTLNWNLLRCKARMVVPNGIDLRQFTILKIPKSDTIPKLVFLGSSNHPWQGIDKLLRLAGNSVGKLEFHIIGIDPPESSPPNITFHGYLERKAYEAIIKTCDIGVGTLALHRKDMDEACPLKTREYLAYGLPVILGYKDTAFTGRHSSPDWALRIPNTENNIDESLLEIIDFSYRMKNYVIDKTQISFIDYWGLEKRRLELMEIVLSQRNEVSS